MTGSCPLCRTEAYCADNGCHRMMGYHMPHTIIHPASQEVGTQGEKASLHRGVAAHGSPAPAGPNPALQGQVSPDSDFRTLKDESSGQAGHPADAGPICGELRLEILKAAVIDWHLGILSASSAMTVLYSLLYPTEVTEADIQWAREKIQA